MKRTFTLTAGILAISIMLSGCSILGSTSDEDVVDNPGNSNSISSTPEDQGGEDTDSSSTTPKPSKDDKSENENKKNYELFGVVDGFPDGFPNVPTISTKYIKDTYSEDVMTSDGSRMWSVQIVATNGETALEVENKFEAAGWKLIRGTKGKRGIWSDGYYIAVTAFVGGSMETYGFSTYGYVISEIK